MLKEAIEAIQKSGIDAAKTQVIAIPGDDRQVILSEGGTHTLHELPPPRRQHIVHSVDDLLRAAKRWGDKKCAVWHDEKQAVLVVNDGERRDVVALPLTFSDKFKTLAGLKGSAAVFDHRKLVRLLRHDLAGSVGDLILPRVRKIAFKRSSDGGRDIQHGKESLGRSVEETIQGVDDFPDGFACLLTVYSTAGTTLNCRVELSLDVDVTNEQFRVEPLPDQLQNALDETQRALHATLVEGLDETTVFWGSPR